MPLLLISVVSMASTPSCLYFARYAMDVSLCNNLHVCAYFPLLYLHRILLCHSWSNYSFCLMLFRPTSPVLLSGGNSRVQLLTPMTSQA